MRSIAIAQFIGFVGLGLPLQAKAQEPSAELLNAALQATAAQRDQALNESVRSSAQLMLAQQEIKRLRQDLEAARKPQPPQEKSK